jgi:hypothetical protein
MIKKGGPEVGWKEKVRPCSTRVTQPGLKPPFLSIGERTAFFVFWRQSPPIGVFVNEDGLLPRG